MMRLSSVGTLLAGVWLAACASGGAAAGARQAVRDPNVITEAELANENSPNVYDAILHLRPSMLRPRLSNATSSINADVTGSGAYTLHVYLGNNLLGTVDDLRSVPVVTVKEIRYLNPSQAMQRFGSTDPGGVILLTLR